MRVVGLTGGIGSGKSAVSQCFAEWGAQVVDTDVIAHQLTGPGATGSAALAAAFGTEILDADGALDRAAMRARVFADAGERVRLEAILHPLIRAATDEALARPAGPYTVLVVPLLANSPSYRALCDRILVVDCPEPMQIERVMHRSGLAAAEVERIIQAQPTRAERLAIADDVIENSGSLSDLRQAAQTLHKRYLALSQLHKNGG